jgi:hypothetical protein
MTTTDVENIHNRQFFDFKWKSIWKTTKKKLPSIGLHQVEIGEFFIICSATRCNSYYEGLVEIDSEEDNLF